LSDKNPVEQSLRISQMIFSSGKSSNEQNFTVDCENVVILVGPNNSGKSTTLREIQGFYQSDEKFQTVVLSQVNFELPNTRAGIQKLLEEFKINNPPENMVLEQNEICIVVQDDEQRGAHYIKINKDEFFENITDGNIDHLKRPYPFLKKYLIMLNGRTRFSLLDSKPRGDMKIEPGNSLAKLYFDVKRIKELDDIIFE